ncbi:MAG: hypothetical protein EZS28_004802 [Streblomastix strix]|uniref:Uncharacterized protein n=1 Tax=Streblomastix strix TaxID=222440 RepID=A0A5J4WZP7_9EUKA|nr:MAG: hypothetical protein EZS28_004802 [Streblomastix strix]
MTQAQQSRFQSWQAGQGQPLTAKQYATVEKMKAGAARKHIDLGQAFNDTQLATLTEIFNVKKFKHRDIKYNKELRILPSAQAYIGSRKSMAGWRVRNVDPDGAGPLPSFATVYTDKGKLYSMGGNIPKLESKYDAFQENYIHDIPKGQRKFTKFFDYMKGKQVPYGKDKVATDYYRLNPHQHYMSAYVPTMAEEFNQNNGGDLWKLKGAYMYVAAAAWDLIIRHLLKIIDTQVNWDAASKETVKQAARIYKNEIATKNFQMVDDDEVALATNIGNLYNSIAQLAYMEKQRNQPMLGYQAPASQMEQD